MPQQVGNAARHPERAIRQDSLNVQNDDRLVYQGYDLGGSRDATGLADFREATLRKSSGAVDG